MTEKAPPEPSKMPARRNFRPKNKNEVEKSESGTKQINEVFSHASLSPQVSAAKTLEKLIPAMSFAEGKNWKPSQFDILAAITEQIEELGKGGLSRLEAILIAQAHTLDRIFNNEIMCAVESDRLDVMKTLMDLALKAQRQCRATLETLAVIKNPQPYVRQQNVAVNQQVNNGPTSGTSHACGENTNTQNELLEENDGQWLDAGETKVAGGANQGLETVGAEHRTKD